MYIKWVKFSLQLKIMTDGLTDGNYGENIVLMTHVIRIIILHLTVFETYWIEYLLTYAYIMIYVDYTYGWCIQNRIQNPFFIYENPLSSGPMNTRIVRIIKFASVQKQHNKLVYLNFFSEWIKLFNKNWPSQRVLQRTHLDGPRSSRDHPRSHTRSPQIQVRLPRHPHDHPRSGFNAFV